MIKKLIALSLFFIATSLIMLHAFIPHHHHEGLVCTAETPDDEKNHDHHHTDTPQKQDRDEKSDHCLLKQIVLMNLNQQKIIKPFSNVVSGTGKCIHFYTAIHDCNCNINVFERKCVYIGYYNPPEIVTAFLKSQALRAPPLS